MDVRLPDGTVIKGVPEGTSKAELAAKLQAKGYDVSGLGVEPPAKQESEGLGYMGGEAARGTAQVLGMPVDAVTGALNFFLSKAGLPQIEKPIGGADSLMSLMNRAGISTEEGRGFLGRLANFAGGSVPIAGAGDDLTRGAQALAQIAKRELGAGVGAATGVEVAQSVAPDSGLAQVAGAAVGGAIPQAVSGGAKALAAGNRAKVAEQVAEASRQGIDLPANVASRNPAVRGFGSVVESIPGGHGPLKKRAEILAEQFGKRVEDIKTSVAKRGDDIVAGRAVQRGIEDFVESTGERGGKLWREVDRVFSGKKIPLADTGAALKKLTKESPETVKVLRTLRGDKFGKFADALQKLEAGSATYDDIALVRSELGAMIGSPSLTSDIPRAKLKQIYGAITQDIKNAAETPAQQKAYARANRYWSARQKRIDDFLDTLHKKVAPEDAINALRTGGFKNVSRVKAAWKSLSNDERKLLRRSMIEDMGNDTAGRQNATGDSFNVEKFLTDWNKVDSRAKNLFFPKSSQYRRDLDALAEIAENVKSGANIFRNPSGTAGRGLAAAMTFSGLLNPALIPGLLGGVAAANVGARLMGSPAFARWMVSASKAPISRLPGHIERLYLIAEKNPEIADELYAYSASLSDALEALPD